MNIIYNQWRCVTLVMTIDGVTTVVSCFWICAALFVWPVSYHVGTMWLVTVAAWPFELRHSDASSARLPGGWRSVEMLHGSPAARWRSYDGEKNPREMQGRRYQHVPADLSYAKHVTATTMLLEYESQHLRKQFYSVLVNIIYIYICHYSYVPHLTEFRGNPTTSNCS